VLGTVLCAWNGVVCWDSVVCLGRCCVLGTVLVPGFRVRKAGELVLSTFVYCTALTLLVGRQEEHPACLKKID